jgi:LysM repeat protein
LAAGDDKAIAQLEVLTKKIDEQNTKIDALSQQLLKLEQQLAAIRPGIMIGETTPAPATSAAAPAASATAVPATGNAHVVTKGETLTSIAKVNRVGVQELQKFNHIENDRALQIGQTIMIPTASAASPAASPSPATPND